MYFGCHKKFSWCITTYIVRLSFWGKDVLLLRLLTKNYLLRWRRHVRHRVLWRGGERERVPASNGGRIRSRTAPLLCKRWQRNCDRRLSHGQHQSLHQSLVPTQLWNAKVVCVCVWKMVKKGHSPFTWHKPQSLQWHMASATPDLRLPS